MARRGTSLLGGTSVPAHLHQRGTCGLPCRAWSGRQGFFPEDADLETLAVAVGFKEVDAPHRARAAFWAISLRRFAVSLAARAGPPSLPIIANTRLTISGEGSGSCFCFRIAVYHTILTVKGYGTPKILYSQVRFRLTPCLSLKHTKDGKAARL